MSNDSLIETPKGNLTPEAFLEWYEKWRTARREQSEAGTFVASLGKKAQAIGIDKLAFQIFEKLSALETDEAESTLKAVIRYGAWAKRGYAVQQDMFHGLAIEKPKGEASRAFDAFEIEDEGYKAGFKGAIIDSNPYPHGEADDARYSLWRTGWQKGQEALVHKTFQGDDEPKPQASPGRRGRPRTRNQPPAEGGGSDDGSTVH